ncbi:phosphoenolpyruvate--protein phosphotransferase [Nitriliruptor alkaliphilus]|uniref:phosphoenolpyruvate--protein phosphotransferase n=1 Tax=Nitriliruptor alkaliphilus TaxID=427918 RepID=UPI000698F924|nr:phosphoenolpyruvate--protein phosphotransferase [Nitriliruptor alkaliphilus]
MSVGIVVVSHSAALAAAAGELAREMAGEDLRLALAGGVDDPDAPLGTDAVRVLAAIEEVDGDDGVLVLMDLGSAVLSAEMAVDLLPLGRADRVLLCDAPLVEGLVAAAVQATAGADLAGVAAEARAGLVGKAAHLGVASPATPTSRGAAAQGADGERDADDATTSLPVTGALGLHARPAARIVETVSRFSAVVTLEHADPDRAGVPVPATSLAGITTLGARRGDALLARARGEDADAVLAALRALADDRFGDPADASEQVLASPADDAENGSSGDPTVDGSLHGLAASPGLAVGPVHRLDGPDLPTVPARRVDDTAPERRRLDAALTAAATTISRSRDELTRRAGGDAGEMLTAHLLLLEDPLLLDPATAAITEDRLDAASAWHRAVTALADTYAGLEDPYLAERAADVRAVGAEVLTRLLGIDAALPPPHGVLVAHDLAPADAARIDPDRVDAIVTAVGSPTSHAALIARSLGIPTVVAAGPAATRLTDGTQVIVDGTRGLIHVDPDPDELAGARSTIADQRADAEVARREAADPATTRDGTHIEVVANIGVAGDAARAYAAGADGVGLLRSELLFLDRAAAPDEDEQVEVYGQACRALAGRPVVLRTLDVGGDKPLPYLELPEELNPFLGTRGLRLGLERPALLTTQLRAALRVAAEHPLRVMLPMVSTVAEIHAARRLLEEARTQLRADGLTVADDLQLGAMVEVPALALLADDVVAEVDFLSIGTNDLTQYVMAAERGNSAVAHLADPLHPAILGLVRTVCDAGARAGVPVAVCGDLASDPAAVQVLVGLGVRELSVPPPAVPAVKRAVRAVDLEEAREVADRALAAGSAPAVRRVLMDGPLDRVGA